jgi:hypothetical protein
MRARLSSLRIGLALMALALCGLWVCTAQAGGRERGRPIEFSEPKSDEVTTNLNQLTNKKDSLKELEGEFYRAMRSFSGNSSLDAMPAPPVRQPSGPVIPSKRAKELLERRKNAVFLTPEDLVAAPTAEQLFKLPEYGPDGVEKQTKAPIERYYESLDAKRAAALKANRSKDDDSLSPAGMSGGRNASALREDTELPAGLKEREQELRKLFKSENAEPTFAPASTKRSSFSDIFGLGEAAPSREQTLKHKRDMQEFQSFLDSSHMPAANSATPNPFGGSSDAQRRAANPFGAPETSFGGNNALGPINPIFSPTGPGDVNAAVLGQPSLTPLLPKTESPKTPPPPTFAAPKRPF